MGGRTSGWLLFIFGKCLKSLFKSELFMMLEYYEFRGYEFLEDNLMIGVLFS